MNLKLEDFEGPFDLLLHFVRVKKVDIYKVNIRDIVDEYLKFISSIPKEDIDTSSEYLVIASELVHLKSRMLINKKDEIDEEDDNELKITSEEDLRNKLIMYEKYKDITSLFKSLEENRNMYHTRVPSNLKEYEDLDKLPSNNVSLNDLLDAFLEMKKRISYKKPLTTSVTKKELSVKKRMNEIRDILKINKKINFFDLFETITKEYIVVTFLSILDMSKNNEIYLYQEHSFSEIIIESR